MQDPSEFRKPPLFGLSSYLQAMQIAQMLKQAHYAEQDRQMRLEDRQQALKDNEATRQRQRTQDTITLNSAGARPIASGFGEPFERAAARGRTVHVGESDYALPTPEMEQAKKVETALALRKLVDPDQLIFIPKELRGILPGGPFGTMTVPKSEALKTSQSLHNSAHPQLYIKEHTDERGNVTRDYIDRRSGETVKTETRQGIGKPSASRSGGKLTAGEIQQQSRAAVLQAMFGGNQFADNPEIAKAIKQRVASGKSRNEQEARWFIAEGGGNPNTLKILYPHLFDKSGKLLAKVDVTKTPEYKEAYARELFKRTAENRAGASTKSGGSQPRSIPASRVAAAAKKNGISVNEMRKRLAARGDEIDEEN